jgi:hypothetical protein
LPVTQSTTESFREILPDAMSFFATPTAPGPPRVSYNGVFTTAAFQVVGDDRAGRT